MAARYGQHPTNSIKMCDVFAELALANAAWNVVLNKYSHLGSFRNFPADAQAEWILVGKRQNDAAIAAAAVEMKARHEMVSRIRRSPRHRSKYYD